MPAIHVLPVAIPFGTIAPRNARSVAVNHRLDEQPIVRSGHANMAFAPRQQLVDTFPLVIAQGLASHWSAPEWLTADESKKALRRNPVNHDTP